MDKIEFLIRDAIIAARAFGLSKVEFDTLVARIKEDSKAWDRMK